MEIGNGMRGVARIDGNDGKLVADDEDDESGGEKGVEWKYRK